MNAQTLAYVKGKTNALIAAPSCSAEAKAAANAWLAAAGTPEEAAETKKYIAELEEDIMPIDGLIAFAESDAGAKVFGAQMAAKVAQHAKDLKAKDAAFCDCPACTAVADILAKKDEMLK